MYHCKDVISADFSERFLTLGDDDVLTYTSLVVATGSIPRVSDAGVPGNCCAPR